MDRPLNVYLLPIDSNRALFYSEEPPPEPIEPPTAKGLRGWAERQFHRFKAAIAESNGAAAQTTRKVWKWLQARTHPDETLLARLRNSKTVIVNHPAEMSPEEAKTLWLTFLAKGRRRHLPWFAVNLAVSPLTALLAPLPGPNLIGYWFVYRAFQHFMILTGLKRMRADQIRTDFYDQRGLDRPTDEGSLPVDLKSLAKIGCTEADLAEFLRRHGVKENEPARSKG